MRFHAYVMRYLPLAIIAVACLAIPSASAQTATRATAQAAALSELTASSARGQSSPLAGDALPAAKQAVERRSVDEAYVLALSRSADLALAAARLRTAEENLAASEPLRSSSLTLGSSLDNSLEVPVAEDAGWTAALSLPVFRWGSLSVKGSGDLTGAAQASAAISIAPFARDATAPAREALLSEIAQYRLAARSAILGLRSELRALDAARSELAYREASLSKAEAALDRQTLLRERGEAAKSDELGALGASIDARTARDEAAEAVASAEAALAKSLGLPSASLPAAPYELERVADPPMDESAWIEASSKAIQSRLALTQAERSAREAVPKPGLTIQTSVAQQFGDKALSTLRLGAELQLPVDLVAGEAARASRETAAARGSAYEAALEEARVERTSEISKLKRLGANLEAARAQVEATDFGLDEAQFLEARGEKSKADVFAARELALKARWALLVAESKLAETLDALDPRFQKALVDPS